MMRDVIMMKITDFLGEKSGFLAKNRDFNGPKSYFRALF